MTARRNSSRMLVRKESEEIEGDLTAIEAACTARERRFVHWLFQLPPKYGFKVQAARLAGYGKNSTPNTLTEIVGDLLKKQRVVDLITEITRKMVRTSAPQAVAVVHEIMADPEHRDRLKAANVVLERLDPTVQRLDVNVKHEVVDRDKEMVNYLRKLKALGVSREKLEEELGYSDLPRYERLLMLEDAAKSGAPTIEGEYEVVE